MTKAERGEIHGKRDRNATTLVALEPRKHDKRTLKEKPFKRGLVRALIVDSKGKYLILQKGETSKSPFLWELPGGKIDHKMGHKSTENQKLSEIIRETFEETEINVEDSHAELVGDFEYTFEYRGKSTQDEVRCFRFRMDEPGSEIPVRIGMHGDEHVAYRWASIQEIARLVETRQASMNSLVIFNHLLASPSSAS